MDQDGQWITKESKDMAPMDMQRSRWTPGHKQNSRTWLLCIVQNGQLAKEEFYHAWIRVDAGWKLEVLDSNNRVELNLEVLEPYGLCHNDMSYQEWIY